MSLHEQLEDSVSALFTLLRSQRLVPMMADTAIPAIPVCRKGNSISIVCRPFL